jgi:hypothetical protein
MNQKILGAVLGIFFLSVGSFSTDGKILQGIKRVGAWQVTIDSDDMIVIAINDSHVVSSKGISSWAKLRIICVGKGVVPSNGQMMAISLMTDEDINDDRLSYKVGESVEKTASWLRWPRTKQGIDFPGDVLAFVLSLPNSGMITLRVNFQDGPSETRFNLIGIDVVRHAFVDVCKI